MRRLLPLLLVAAAAAFAASPATAAKTQPKYYLALGTSVTGGMQPDELGQTRYTNDGYANQLFAAKRKSIRGLKLINLACGGETTTSFIGGRQCKYSGGSELVAGSSQLDAARKFLRKYRSQVAFVTLDLGANDFVRCIRQGVIEQVCFNAGLERFRANTPKIAKALRSAAGSKVPMAVMTYFDPYLQLMLKEDQASQDLGRASVALVQSVNDTITKEYGVNQRFKIADVFSAFDTTDFDTQVDYNGRQVSENVRNICTYTWMCSEAPVNDNIHPKTSGYRLIAETFRKVL